MPNDERKPKSGGRIPTRPAATGAKRGECDGATARREEIRSPNLEGVGASSDGWLITDLWSDLGIRASFGLRNSSFGFHSSFVIRNSIRPDPCSWFQPSRSAI